MQICRTLPSYVEAGGISSDTAALAPPLLMVRLLAHPCTLGRAHGPATALQYVAALGSMRHSLHTVLV